MTIAAGIVSRNLPERCDPLGDLLKPLVDHLYVVENGSDSDKYSKHANIINKESLGATYAINQLCNIALEKGYEFLWICYNDAWFINPKEYLDWSIENFNKDPSLAMTVNYWNNVWSADTAQGNPQRACSVSFFDPISFIVRTDVLSKLAAHNSRLTPLVDSTNYASHFVFLGTSLALHRLGYHIITDPRFEVQELQFYTGDKEKDDVKSLETRGYDDATWRSKIGPAEIQKYMSSTFPEFDHLNVLKISNKQKRDYIIREICNLWNSRKK